jgi:signal transduction histidine kinase
MSATPQPMPERATAEHKPSKQNRLAPRENISPWQAVRQWMTDNTFVPSWLPEPLRHPISGYVLAAALQVVASVATLLVLAATPEFSFSGILNTLVVALVALSWGAAPSLLATVVGAALLEVFLPQTSHGGVTHASDMVEIALFLVVGVIIGVVASGTELARRRAVNDYTQEQARGLILSETNARTDEFLSIASHELRTPLTSLKAAMQLGERRLQRLAAQETPPADWIVQLQAVEELLSTAEQQVERQNRLVGDLLDVSRIRANKLEFHVAICDLATIVHDAVDEQRLSWPDRTIFLDLPDTVLANADAHRIGQVVTNYLTNALKYSPEDAPVAVALRLDGTMARVSVRDQGPGLTPEQRDHIWERFHRVPGIKQQSGSGAGLGLGLHIARTIIAYHGGEVGIESVSGGGSTFWFTLPLAIPAAAAAELRPPHG